MSPLGSFCTQSQARSPPREKKSTSGVQAGAHDLRRSNENRRRRRRGIARDGKAFGISFVRGPWVLKDTSRARAASPLRDGWFPDWRRGNVDAGRFYEITDRSKDVTSPGGEGISSIDLENIAVAHPAIAEARSAMILRVADRAAAAVTTATHTGGCGGSAPPVETNSVRTFFQSHSSSSATSMGRPVERPAPSPSAPRGSARCRRRRSRSTR